MKKVPPKKAMKQLGYRSLDSFLKHETSASVLSAALISEDHHWQKRYLNELKRSRPTDFENRSITIAQLDSRRWSRLAERAITERKHNLLCLKELGAIIFLPCSLDRIPAGTTTVSLVLGLHELNEIRAASTFWKLCQVRPDFGDMVVKVARDEPKLNARLIDQHMPWKLIQRYYAQAIGGGEEVFEPHLQLEDMAWHPIEASVRAIEPSMDFWHSSAHLGLLHERGPVSCNLLDAALNYCNQLPFERRIVRYFQHSLWHDLMLRYLHRNTVERAVLHELQPQFAEELAPA